MQRHPLLRWRVFLHQITLFNLLVKGSRRRGSPGLCGLRTRLNEWLPELEQAASSSARCELSSTNIDISWVICNTTPAEQAAAVISKPCAKELPLSPPPATNAGELGIKAEVIRKVESVSQMSHWADRWPSGTWCLH